MANRQALQNSAFRQVILILACLVLACGLALFAQVGEAHASWSAPKDGGDGIAYRIDYDANKVQYTGYYNGAKPTSITIPAEKEGCTDISIQYGAFRMNENLQSVTINAALTEIPELCFYKCTSLESITVPDSVTSIGKVSFYGCTSLATVDLGSGVESIGEQAFMACEQLGTITLPQSLSTMGKAAFSNCLSLTDVTFAEGAPITILPDEAFNNCQKLSSVTLQPGLKTIGVSAFDNCKALSSCVIPGSVTEIGKEAFRYAGITSVTLPDGLTTLGDNAFGYSKLAKINPLPSSLANIGTYAFSNCQFEYAALPDTITAIPNGMFFACNKMKSIALPRQLKSIGKDAFYRCSALEYLCIPESVTSIGNYALELADANNKCAANRVYFANGTHNWAGMYVFGDKSKVNYPGLTVVMAEGGANVACKNETLALGAQFKTTAETGVYAITHNPNGGSGSMANVTLPKGVAYAVPICTYTKSDGSFKCWKSTNGTELQPGQLMKITENTATAIWDAWGGSGYTITFRSGDGGEGSDFTMMVKKGDVLTFPTCSFAAKPGYAFAGWQLPSYYGGIVVSPGMRLEPNANWTLKAVWTTERTITFDPMGGTVSPTTMKTNGQGRLDTWPTATRKDYVFDCWSTTEDSGGAVSAGRVFTADTMLHAIWEKVETPVITFDPNGGTIVKGKSSMATNSSGVLQSEMPTAERPGYKFVGWFTSGGIQMTISDVFTGSMTLHAKWEKSLATGVHLDKTSVSLKPSGTATIKATVLPATAVQKVTWSSANAKVAKVDASGKVTAVAEGTTTVKAATTDGTNKSATCKVVVSTSGGSGGGDTPTPGPGPDPDPGSTNWKRLAGDNALETMSKIVDEGGFAKGGTVVLASLEGYWDALTAAGIAGLEKAPVLMALQDAVSDQTSAQLAKLAPKKIVVCGGTYWLPDALLAEAASAAGTSPEVVRLAGENAAQTAAKIAAEGKGKWSDTAIVATAGTFQDALAAAPVSYAKAMPIFLAQFDFAKEEGSIDKSTVKAMKDAGIARCYIAGGTYWLPEQVSKDLEAAGIKVLGQLGGASAVETSGLIAELATKELGMKADKMGVADVRAHYDALASAAFCGQKGSVLVLVRDANRSVVDTFVKPNAAKIGQGYVFGGTGSVSDASMAALQSATK